MISMRIGLGKATSGRLPRLGVVLRDPMRSLYLLEPFGSVTALLTY